MVNKDTVSCNAKRPRPDFLRLADGHTFVDITPAYLIQVIDGFLGEEEEVVFGGDRAELRRQRQVLVGQIGPAYEQGAAAGRRSWQQGPRVFGVLSVEELHHLALQLAPPEEMVRGCFAEGFCYSYAIEELESLREEL
jgi:hypothetical protein